MVLYITRHKAYWHNFCTKCGWIFGVMILFYKARRDATLASMQMVLSSRPHKCKCKWFYPWPLGRTSFAVSVSAANHFAGKCLRLQTSSCHKLPKSIVRKSVWQIMPLSVVRAFSKKRNRCWQIIWVFVWQQYLWKVSTGAGSNFASAFATNMWWKDVYYAHFVTLSLAVEISMVVVSQNFTFPLLTILCLFLHILKLSSLKLFQCTPLGPSLVQI